MEFNKALGFRELSFSGNNINYELNNDYWNIVPKTYKSFVKKIIKINKVKK